MERKTITNSSQILGIGYDAKEKIFEVTYKQSGDKQGVVYHYFDVEPQIWEDAQKAESTGKFVAAYVKNHKFQKVV